jgi:hypothetical protein
MLFVSVVLVVVPSRALASEPLPADAPATDAAPPPPPPRAVAPSEANEARERLATFRAVVSAQSEREHGYRWVGGFAELAVGATLLPAGVALYSRHGSALTGSMIGLGAAGLLGGLGTLTLGGDASAHLDAERAMVDARARGLGDAAVLAAGEQSLKNAAERARLERRVGGLVCTGLGAVALGLGATFASADFTGRGFDREQQDGVAMALLLGGAIATTEGLRAAILPSSAEVTWETYEKTARARTQGASPSVAFGMAPSPGGASVGVTGTF